MEGNNKEKKMNYYGLTIFVPEQVYEPSDDTDLCIEFLLRWVQNLPAQISDKPKKIRILEMGVGSGALSLYLISRLITKQYFPDLTGIDINPLAIETSKKNAKMNNLSQYATFYIGDYFKPLRDLHISEPFRIIVFNPPYLASELETINEKNRQMIDLAWEGGPEGNEVTLEFLSQINPFLSQDGELLLISSSNINQVPILNSLNQNNLIIIEEIRNHIFFEDIILYHVKRRN